MVHVLSAAGYWVRTLSLDQPSKGQWSDDGETRIGDVTDKSAVQSAMQGVTVSHPAAAGGVFNVTDGAFHTLNEIIESICSALGRKPPQLSLPISPTRALVGLVEKGSRSIGIKPPVTREIIDKYTEDIAVDGSFIQKELGFMPQYDLKTGWEEMIREMRT